MRTAVKYSIDNILKKYPEIDNFKKYNFYIDKVVESSIINFLNENKPKFIFNLNMILGKNGMKVFTVGPFCTYEIRFKGAVYDKNAGKNSRIYAIKENSNLILCYLSGYKKENKVEKKIERHLKKLCKEQYMKIESTKNLITI